MSNKSTLESRYRVWDDGVGCYYEVCDDGDGLDLIEIRYSEDGTKINKTITLTLECASDLVTALQKKIQDVTSRKDRENA